MINAALKELGSIVIILVAAMASREEFGALLQQADGGFTQSIISSAPSWEANKGGDTAPLLPPIPQSVSAAPSRPTHHGRSRSDYQFVGSVVPPLPAADPTHPFNIKGMTLPTSRPNRFNRPPRAYSSGVPQPPPPPPQSVVSPLSIGSPSLSAGRKKLAHRRAKSDIPLAMYGSGAGGGGRVITKADLLKNLPSPRWGVPAPKPLHTRSRSRTGSDNVLLSDTASLSSGGGYGGGYGAIDHRNHPILQSVTSVDSGGGARHKRIRSDASIKSVTTNMTKSALLKEVTDTGRLRLQLPKDSFRILMDSQLEAGSVYKRKLVDNEDEFFVEFHTSEEDPVDAAKPCHCTCEGCNRCHDKQKRLPPDLYVMAVDSTIYRRMLDEIIASKTMPCGIFFCGHYEDVRYPDITIAALIVGVVFFLLCATIYIYS